MNLTDILKTQYQLVKSSRNALLVYCEGISKEDLISEQENFANGGSVRNLLVHITNCYRFWIGKQALKQPVVFPDFETISSIEDIRVLFSQMDEYMQQFLLYCDENQVDMFDVERSGTVRKMSVIELFSHVITHEFHHKGQIVSIGRLMGYLPPDTDVIR